VRAVVNAASGGGGAHRRRGAARTYSLSHDQNGKFMLILNLAGLGHGGVLSAEREEQLGQGCTTGRRGTDHKSEVERDGTV